MNLYQTLFTPNPFLRVVSSFHPSTTLFLVGILEGFKELRCKHLTWKKVIKNRLGEELRWRRSRTGRTLSPPQIHQKNS